MKEDESSEELQDLEEYDIVSIGNNKNSFFIPYSERESFQIDISVIERKKESVKVSIILCCFVPCLWICLMPYLFYSYRIYDRLIEDLKSKKDEIDTEIDSKIANLCA